jgi:glycosyltransferase involved in cell wall biosynthesis
MKIVIMTPAYNEEKTIGAVIKAIPRDIAEDVKVIVIDDGSTDNTVKVAKESGADKVISHNTNKGLGVAFQTGIETALKTNADIIVNIDADGQFNPNDIPRLIKPIIGGKADMVTCSRFLDKNLEPDMPGIKKFGNNIFTKLVSRLTNQKFTDTQCGFRAYSIEAALRLTLFGVHTYTQEVFLDQAMKGMGILEIPCKVKGEREGKSRLVTNVFSYGLKVLLIIIRSFRDYQPLKFFGTIGFGVFFIGFVIGITMFIRWIFTGMVSPYRSLVNISMLFLIMGFLLLILALIADMFDRHRKLQEEILYRLKNKEYKEGNQE